MWSHVEPYVSKWAPMGYASAVGTAFMLPLANGGAIADLDHPLGVIGNVHVSPPSRGLCVVPVRNVALRT